ncbi:unnamed protein product [Symbiodinium sp. CCMP2456]|nr:unnamed protein product [Symbiodinium sp. CCMP2456]
MWVGDSGLPAYQQGLKVLGAPLGTDEFVVAQLHTLSAQHRALLELLPSLPDLQVAWLLLLYCANPRAQHILRAVPPALTAVFAAEHDRSMLHCLALLLQVRAAPDDPLPGLAIRRAHLPLRHGGLGLRSAAAHAPAAFFASWADSLRAIRARESESCDQILQQLAGPSCHIRCLASDASLQGAAIVLTNHGLAVPAWGELLAEPPPEAEADPALHEPADLAHGWQRTASKAVDDALLADLTSALDEASIALLHSQGGPFAGRVYTALPTCPELRLDSAAYEVLLLRRLRLPLPLDAAACR